MYAHLVDSIMKILLIASKHNMAYHSAGHITSPVTFSHIATFIITHLTKTQLIY